MSMIDHNDILNAICCNDYYRGDDIFGAVQCLAEGKTVDRVVTLEDKGKTVVNTAGYKGRDKSVMDAEFTKNDAGMTLKIRFDAENLLERIQAIELSRAFLGAANGAKQSDFDWCDGNYIKHAVKTMDEMISASTGDDMKDFRNGIRYALSLFGVKRDFEEKATPAAGTVKRGCWVQSDIPGEKYTCSKCGGGSWYYDCSGDIAKSRYCPNCGADMSNLNKTEVADRDAQFRDAAEPLRVYLEKYGDPHTSVTVTRSRVVETRDERGVTRICLTN